MQVLTLIRDQDKKISQSNTIHTNSILEGQKVSFENRLNNHDNQEQRILTEMNSFKHMH